VTITPRNSGWIEVICGSMFSGKTEELIRRLRRAQIAQMAVTIFKPRIDDRYSEQQIVSHNQTKMTSHIVNNIDEIKVLGKLADVVGIDEAQFFDSSILKVCKILADSGKRVIVAGLDTDYRGLPFGPMPQLMCEADYLDKFRAICIKCGNPASYSQRISFESEQVVVGELDKYEARCRNCFEEPKE
jgi:thymidine kinase|tara:strand:- start:6932 stop:7492 length:561 start_codon:yes stop_codon:yes gene_type:complete